MILAGLSALFAISALFLVALADERWPSGAIRPPPYAKVDVSLVSVGKGEKEREGGGEEEFAFFKSCESGGQPV